MNQPLLGLDHETYFERLLQHLHDDKEQRSALLTDELPIFLKGLHDKGSDGVDAARNVMNRLSRLRVHAGVVAPRHGGRARRPATARTANRRNV